MKIFAIVFVGATGLVLGGLFLANITDEQVEAIVSIIMVLIIFGAVLAGLAMVIGTIAGIRYLLLKADKENLIHPDENGNYPIKYAKQYTVSLWPPKFVWKTIAVNLNLTGADTHPEAYVVHQMTNNKGGSHSSALAQKMMPQQPQVKLIGPPQQVTSLSSAPPIIIDARKAAEHL